MGELGSLTSSVRRYTVVTGAVVLGGGGGWGAEFVRVCVCVCVCVPNHVAHLFKFRLLVGDPCVI